MLHDAITDKIIGAALQVHRAIGLAIESIYLSKTASSWS